MNAAQRSAQTQTAPAAAPIASINRTNPPFPCKVIGFSKQPGNTAHDVFLFSENKPFAQYRTLMACAIRVILILSDLADVPTATLLAIYNQYRSARGEKPLDRFRDRTAAETKVFEILPEIATKYEESPMATAAAATPANKTEAKAAEKAATKAAKAAEKQAAKDAAKAAKVPGVIDTVRTMLDSKTGATQNEILDVLVKNFPTRTREGMSSTVKIQCSRLATSTKDAAGNLRKIINADIEGRGRVYRFADLGTIPGKVVAPTAPAETAEPKAEAKKGSKKGAKVEAAAPATEAAK